MGVKQRNRSCTDPLPKFGGEDCFGNSTDIKDCNTHHCPIHGEWTLWASWSVCSESCSGGVQTRNRSCSAPKPQFDGDDCVGNDAENIPCNAHPCPINGNWTTWSEWNTCSLTCGGGSHYRERTCTDPEPKNGGDYCYGKPTDLETCNNQSCPVDGGWMSWSAWSHCSVSCDGGSHFRNRSCSDPVPQYGGKTCSGNDTDINECNTEPCPIDGDWGSWSEWSRCTFSCGEGFKQRNRTCSDPEPDFGGMDCMGNATDVITCNTHPCPIDGDWASWSAWTSCSFTCGGGHKFRNRSCTDPAPQFGGKPCLNFSSHRMACNTKPCPVNGNWTLWSEWSACSSSCGGGSQYRNRSCTNPKPKYGGEHCFGNKTDLDICNVHPCPIDGNWTSWSSWGSCSLTCGGGIQYRNRSCSEPEPKYGGENCTGNINESSVCNSHECPIDGNWSVWSEWSTCSLTCGGGLQDRIRSCSNPVPQYGGDNCTGNMTEASKCNDFECPIDGNWTIWSEWNLCSLSCGGGHQTRNRSCTEPEPQYGGSDCIGNTTDVNDCNKYPCPIDGQWTRWSEWSTCSLSCGGGNKERNRSCANPEPRFGGDDCNGNNTDINACNTQPCPVNGNWTSWSEWSQCSLTCGTGFQNRNRSCSDPEPLYGGNECIGNATDVNGCNEHSCPIDGSWTTWTEWNACSIVCGGGFKQRNRSCADPEPQYDGKYCFGNSTDINECNTHPCPIDGDWTTWSEWSSCSLSCGGGHTQRNRSCTSPEPQHGGNDCTGNLTEIITCNNHPCPIDGNWTSWSEWSMCSLSCGEGLQYRNRSCSDPEPKYGGEDCFGNTTDFSVCHTHPCPIDGNWAKWSKWGSCSFTCGGGLQYRNRTCNDPEPQYGGQYCNGNLTDVSKCNTYPCPIDGNWTLWSEWSVCSLTCGAGTRYRNRTCDNPEPQYGGEECIGSSTDMSECNTQLCPVDGNWAFWSKWGICSLTCGGGIHHRNRTCNDPEPQYGGEDCIGNSTDISNCNTHPCPIDGNWASWSEWGTCSFTCGSGTHYRNRTCNDPEPQHGGENCIGNLTDFSNCNTHPCPINGNWASWSEWGTCTSPCGGGFQLRNRSCNDPEPLYGGEFCQGNTTDVNECNTHPCPVNGNWSDWSKWGDCSLSCGGGLRMRERRCDEPEPRYGGEDCSGNITENDPCNTHFCPG